MHAGPSSCPAAAELVADLVVLIVLHSDFQPLMAQLSADPLPTAATHLAVPLTSLLPFVSMHADAQQQVRSQLRSLPCIALGRLCWPLKRHLAKGWSTILLCWHLTVQVFCML